MRAWRRPGGRVGSAAGIGLVAAAVGMAALAGPLGRGAGEPVRGAADSRAPATSPGPTASPSPAGTRPATWQRVEPGGRTRCGRGGRFAFWARPGAPDRLLVFFQGGGGCWDYRSCAPGTAVFDDRVDDGDDPSVGGAGVLDLDDPRNPFRGWSVLYVPSCTGDVYAGDAVRTYRAADGRAVTVHHRGHVNAVAALDWVARRVPEPRRVFVTGCSAGSIGSILHASRVIGQYPRAQVAQLGDSLGYLFSRPTDLRSLWGADRLLAGWTPRARAVPPARFTMPRFYRAVASHHPRASFAQVNFYDDAVQRRFHEATGGAPGEFRRALLGNLAAIRSGSPNFRSCLLEGSTHCALPRPDFYRLRSGGVPLRDWVAALAEGDPVADLPPGS
jgi:Pectinacetylesterase